MIHHRLASLYHHSYRATIASDQDNARSKKLKQLSELHYGKATSLFIALDMNAQAIRTILERAGLLEASANAGKYKTLLQILDIILETKEVVHKIIERGPSDDNEEEERKMLETIVQRLQFTLLSIVKSGTTTNNVKSKKKGDKKSTSVENVAVKELYGKTLKFNVNGENFTEELHKLLEYVAGERVNL